MMDVAQWLGRKVVQQLILQKWSPELYLRTALDPAFSLSVGDTVKQSPAMKDCLGTLYELVKLIKFSPKREVMLRELKEEIGNDASGM